MHQRILEIPFLGQWQIRDSELLIDDGDHHRPKAGFAVGGLWVEDLILFFGGLLTVRHHSYLVSDMVF
jgi:hypothetical protein